MEGEDRSTWKQAARKGIKQKSPSNVGKALEAKAQMLPSVSQYFICCQGPEQKVKLGVEDGYR